jgi:tetratricopeptide (TPR) repeat protein
VEHALEAVVGESADEAGLAPTCYVLAYVLLRRGDIREMERVARRGLGHADRSGHPREVMAARMTVAWAVIAGSTPVPDCIRICEQLVPVLGLEHPQILGELAGLHAMLGDIDDARRVVTRARRLTLERMRGRSTLLLAAQSSGRVELLAGDLAAGERELRVALELALDAGLREPAAQSAARLSQIRSAQYDPAGAERLASLSREKAPAESAVAQALWRAAAARVLADRDDHVEAERLARQAVELVPREMLNARGSVLVNLAKVLLAAGRRDAALPVINEAIEAYDRKSNLVSAARARVMPTLVDVDRRRCQRSTSGCGDARVATRPQRPSR